MAAGLRAGAGIGVAASDGMATGLQGRNQRGSPRVDVLLRVKGELVPAGFPITIVNVNRTGFALLSEVWFRPGDRLDLRLTPINGTPVHVTGAVVHAQPRRGAPGLYMTGCIFQPERSGGALPDADIRQLISAVAPAGFKI